VFATADGDRAHAQVPLPAPRSPLWLGFSLALAYLSCASGCLRSASTAPGEAYDAGYVFAEKQSTVTHDFVVRNTTSETVHVLSLAKSCTCASAELGKSTLGPGESTRLRLDVGVPRGYMQKTAACYIRTDHPALKDWVYSIQLVSLPFISANPTDLNLGTLGPGGKTEQAAVPVEINLFSPVKTELAPESFVVPKEIRVEILAGPEFRRLRQDIWNTRYRLSVGFGGRLNVDDRGAAHPGVATGAIKLVTSGSAQRDWAYPVYWTVQAPLVSWPSSLNFGNLRNDKVGTSRALTISSQAKNDFRILRVTSVGQSVSTEAQFDPSLQGDSHRVTVTMAPRSDTKARLLTGVIRVETSERLQSVLDVPWTAIDDGPASESNGGAKPRSSPLTSGL
jgi:hypothetical protein